MRRFGDGLKRINPLQNDRGVKILDNLGAGGHRGKSRIVERADIGRMVMGREKHWFQLNAAS